MWKQKVFLEKNFPILIKNKKKDERMNQDRIKSLTKALTTETFIDPKMDFEQLRDLLISIKEEIAISNKTSLKIKSEHIDQIKEVIDHYHLSYKNTNWSTCCNGRECCCMGKPTDPEYYLYQILTEIENLIE